MQDNRRQGNLLAILFHLASWHMDLSYFGRGLLGSWPQADIGVVFGRYRFPPATGTKRDTRLTTTWALKAHPMVKAATRGPFSPVRHLRHLRQKHSRSYPVACESRNPSYVIQGTKSAIHVALSSANVERG